MATFSNKCIFAGNERIWSIMWSLSKSSEFRRRKNGIFLIINILRFFNYFSYVFSSRIWNICCMLLRYFYSLNCAKIDWTKNHHLSFFYLIYPSWNLGSMTKDVILLWFLFFFIFGNDIFDIFFFTANISKTCKIG